MLLWTLLVSWALLSMLIAGEFVSVDHCHHAMGTITCPDDVARLQRSWTAFLKGPLSGTYLILLGVPGAAAVAAKQVTTNDVKGQGFKKPKPPIPPDVKQKHPVATRAKAPLVGLAEIFSDDDGATDIGDFQYLIFNVITAVYFVAQFLHPDGKGLPTIPNTLLGLTGVSASVYIGKKAATDSSPTVTGVFPQPLHNDAEFTVLGTGLVNDPASPGGTQSISIDGMLATEVWEDGDTLRARAPSDIAAGSAVIARNLQVKNGYGGLTTTSRSNADDAQKGKPVNDQAQTAVTRTDKGFAFGGAGDGSRPKIAPANADGPLGLLFTLPGTWKGRGFNTIWRPHHGDGQDRFLELNLTSETLVFTHINGLIPNRGLLMPDIEMAGVTYMQQIADADNEVGLHIEPGIWLTCRVPRTPASPRRWCEWRRSRTAPRSSLRARRSSSPAAGPSIPDNNIIPFPIGTPPAGRLGLSRR